MIRENLLRDLLRLIVWYPIRLLVRILPVRCALPTFRLMGDVHYFLSRRKKAVLLENLKGVFTENSGQDKFFFQNTTRNYFRNFYVSQLIIWILPRLNKNNIGLIHTFRGLEKVDHILEKGKGCILVISHFGPFPLIGQAAGVMGYSLAQLRFFDDGGLSFIGRHVALRLRVKYETRLAFKTMLVTSFLRPLVEWLKNNRIAATIGDSTGGERSFGKFLVKEFLGKPAEFSLGPAVLSRRTGAPIVFCFCVLQPDGRYQSIIHEPKAGGDNVPDEKMVDMFVEKSEYYVRKYPYLWYFWDVFQKGIP